MSRPILLLDSGVGGLTILSAVRNLLPAHDYVYLADWGNYPYGARTRTELIMRLRYILERAISLYDPLLAVVACNTASTVALPALREQWPNLPFVGVVPAVKPAARLTRSRSIAVLATAGTVANGYTENLCKEFAPGCRVELIAAPLLVDMAEKYMADASTPIELGTVAHAVMERAPRADTCVLACTHFPILRESLAAALPQIHYWVDSSAAIARRVASLMPPESATEGSARLRLVCTAAPKVPHFSRQWQAELNLANSPQWIPLPAH